MAGLPRLRCLASLLGQPGLLLHLLCLLCLLCCLLCLLDGLLLRPECLLLRLLSGLLSSLLSSLLSGQCALLSWHHLTVPLYPRPCANRYP